MNIVLGNVVENKIFVPTNQEPKIIQEDCIQGLKQVSLDDTITTFDSSDINFDSCTLSEVISLLHKMSRDPHTSTHLILPSRSISQMLLSKLGRRSLE